MRRPEQETTDRTSAVAKRLRRQAMRIKLGFLIGFGAGYVLGAKAGTERYEQLKRLYGNLISSPEFREASDRAKEAASGSASKVKGAVGTGLEQAKEVASEGASKVKGAVKDRRADDTRPGGLTVAPPTASSTEAGPVTG
jgi:uncharacterized protein YjbJ (UPF0337 family)